jgi:hypothetical protein
MLMLIPIHRNGSDHRASRVIAPGVAWFSRVDISDCTGLR